MQKTKQKRASKKEQAKIKGGTRFLVCNGMGGIPNKLSEEACAQTCHEWAGGVCWTCF